MTFVNEFIPPQDIEKYGLKAIDEKIFVGRTRARDWTIDRSRDIYLRNIARGAGADPDFRNQTTWTFHWRGNALNIRLDLLEVSGGNGEPGWSHWVMVRLNGSYGLPEHLKPRKAEILSDLKDALTAYQGAGMYSAEYTSYSVTLDVAGECLL